MRSFFFSALAAALAIPTFAQGHMRPTDHPTALDTYVAAPDEHYKFELVNKTEREDWSSYVIHMTSQQWLTEAEVDKPIWEHWVTIVVPAKVEHETAFLYIGGGSNDKPAPKGPGVIPRKLALETNSIAVELTTVPSEPLAFTDEGGKKRSEDSIIAYTWDKFMKTGDPKWPLRLPMTKSAVRAMDTVQQFCKESLPTPVEVKDFVVGGGSKRGWTTWTTAIVDTRVKAITPIVINMLNVIPSFRHHYAVYGFWAPAVDDYVEMGIMNRMETPEYAELMKIEEPFSYLERLTMPKFIINAASDEFFLPDSTSFYYDQLPGDKRLRMIPNTGHGLSNSDVLDSVTAFYHCILAGQPLPEYSWTTPDAQTIEVKSPTAPKEVLLWQVTNEKERDFRLDQVGPSWTSTPLTASAEGVYTGKVEMPEKGFRAYTIELTYDVPADSDLKFTTPVRVVPDVEPHGYTPEPNPIPGYLTKK